MARLFSYWSFWEFWCSFLDFTKDKKVRSWSSFWGEFSSSLKYHFLSLIWIYKLLFSRITSILGKTCPIVTALYTILNPLFKIHTFSSIVSNLVSTMPSIVCGFSCCEWSARAALNLTSWSIASLPTRASPTKRTRSGAFTEISFVRDLIRGSLSYK